MPHFGIQAPDNVRDFGEQFEEVTSTKSGTKRSIDVNIQSKSGSAIASTTATDDLDNPTTEQVISHTMVYDEANDNWDRARPSTQHDLDSGGGEEMNLGVSLRTAASGGSVAHGVEDNPLVTASPLVPEEHDYIALTYVAAGNGAGEIETVTYKEGGSGGTTVATLTLAYDSSDRLTSVTRS